MRAEENARFGDKNEMSKRPVRSRFFGRMGSTAPKAWEPIPGTAGSATTFFWNRQIDHWNPALAH